MRLPATGRETERPGAAQRRRRRAADPHTGSDFQQAFPRGHGGFIQHPSTPLFQDLDFSWKFLLADVAFPILGVDFLRAHNLLIDPVDNALLDSTGRRLTGQLLRSPPTATVVVSFVQPHKPVAEPSSPSAHTAGAASAGETASAGPASTSSPPSAHTAGAASAGAASARAASAGPVSAGGGQAASAAAGVKLPSGLSAAALSAARPTGQQNPAQMKAAYNLIL